MFRLKAAALTFGLLVCGPAQSAELLMFRQAWCHWCDQWEREIGVVYEKTDESHIAPLRRLDIHDSLSHHTLQLRPRFTPTFVLVSDGKEVGRIEGYPGEAFFWGLLGKLLEQLPPPN